ncbi:MAG: signal peptide peptidase SppA [Legionellales bacterium RIFCSPHIGHO2_12_FULL_37_14]|nr:MAG: signal peptide peptidase SppA [Legionellales bacterium RIFCSPHIGHO2_12_FULL_37_14]
MDKVYDGTKDAQTLLNQLVLDFMKEQKRKRRFRWAIRFIILGVVLFSLYGFYQNIAEETVSKNKPHVGLIDVNGEIGQDDVVNADDFTKSLDTAFKNSNMKAIVIRVNSPGGSPVQADYIYNQIRYYRAKNKEVPVYAVCMDICASAAYYIAAAADEIYANPSSMVGSIGVLYNGFGFVDSLQKLGVTRRLYTAGKNKGFLDPFSPVDPSQVPLLQAMLDQVHNTFITKVKEGRGSKLVNNQEIFSGLIWTGIEAKNLGLIDGFASAGQLMRDKLKIEQAIDYTYKRSVFERMSKNINTLAPNVEKYLSYGAGRLK